MDPEECEAADNSRHRLYRHGSSIAMIVLPGPAVIVIPIGLGILATEFVWARTILKHAKERMARFRKKAEI
ncbi:PGPGW domain-containing protein, partial [Geotalea toluenoxydans]|uniref:PGPGW domain-containing protein n=1 Tax=Geotalea toluenoxydans TaxID=421624 RepID=UPI001FB45283